MPRIVRRSLLRVFAIAPLLLVVLAYCRGAEHPTEAASTAIAPSLDATVATPAVLIGASDIGTCSGVNDEATAKLLDVTEGTVMVLGDGAYSTGSAAEYANCFGPTWGRHLNRIRPSPGERDYATTGAAGYFGYFGAAAGSPTEGWYSYDLGEWHVIVLNSEVSIKDGSPQIQWLKQDLLANPRACTVAYWHDPRFYSGSSTPRSALEPAWKILYAAGADVVVNGHSRFYERFAPQRPDEVADPAFGIRQFISGVGGAGTSSFTTRRPNSEVIDRSTYGVLKLTLGTGTYDWQFIPIAGKTFTDAGSGTCHGPPPPVANAGGPYSSVAVVAFDGGKSVDLQGNYPLTYAWDFGDGTTGTGQQPIHEYAEDGSYTVTLVVTDALGDVSAAATASVVIANAAPVVDAGFEQTAKPDQAVTIAARFTDSGRNDSPWSYSVDWGDGTAATTGSIGSASEQVGGTHAYAATGDYTVTVTVTDAQGAAGSDRLAVRVRPPGTPFVLIGAGDIAMCGTQAAAQLDEATSRILDAHPDATVFTAGDNAYSHGSAADYANCYEPTWGRHKWRTFAAIGNHEYDYGNANPTWDYFGERAGPRGKGYYSFDLGEWHIIVLNDNSAYTPMGSGTEQDLWLQADLARNTKKCTLAIWHQPMVFSSPTSTTYRSTRLNFWRRLYAAGAELVINGHHHFYERFAPMDPNRVVDEARGLREFIVGVGGERSAAPTAYIAPNSEVRGSDAGVIKLTLRDDSYDWEFIPVEGATFRDSGSATCH